MFFASYSSEEKGEFSLEDYKLTTKDPEKEGCSELEIGNPSSNCLSLA